MAKRMHLAEILKKHPEVDAVQLQRALDLFDELRKSGLAHPQWHGSSPPLVRRRARLMDDLVDDPRAVRLRSQ